MKKAASKRKRVPKRTPRAPRRDAGHSNPHLAYAAYEKWARSLLIRSRAETKGQWAKVDSPAWNKLRAYVEAKIASVLGPPVDVEKVLQAQDLPPLYCSVCKRPVGWGGAKAGPPGDVDARRCGFLVVYCKRCEKEIGNPLLRLDHHVEQIAIEHDVYHKALSIEQVIVGLRRQGSFRLDANA